MTTTDMIATIGGVPVDDEMFRKADVFDLLDVVTALKRADYAARAANHLDYIKSMIFAASMVNHMRLKVAAMRALYAETNKGFSFDDFVAFVIADLRRGK